MEEIIGYLDNDDDEIELVDEGEELISDSRYLYTKNIYSCVAIYVLGDEDSYLAHILVEDKQREFTNGFSDKVRSLYEFASEQNSKIYIGLVYGVAQDPLLRDRYHAIEDDLEDIIARLENEGKDVERLETTQSEFVLIDNEARSIYFEHEDYDLGEGLRGNKGQR